MTWFFEITFFIVSDEKICCNSCRRQRKQDEERGGQAVFGNWLATRMMKYMLGGYEFTDLGPFRVIRYQSLIELNMTDQDFGYKSRIVKSVPKYFF